MFKSKVDFNAFDLNNKKVKNVEEPKIKALSKHAVKKLLKHPGERAPFYLILDYFKDKSKKPLTHFLCFGINKRMEKHFEQVELKSGKLEQSMSASQKEASMGEVYCKVEGSNKVLCFEPNEKSKIPGGKWPKILKTLKPFLAGAKAVVVLGGQVVGEDAEGVEKTNDQETADTATAENASPEAAEGLVDGFKAQLEEIANHLKETLPKDIIPKVRNRTVELADLEMVQGIKSKITSFEEAYVSAAESIQGKLASMRESVAKQAPKVDQIISAVEALLDAVGSSSTEEDTTVLQELLDLAIKGLDAFDKKYDALKEELENATPEPLPEGPNLLAKV